MSPLPGWSLDPAFRANHSGRVGAIPVAAASPLPALLVGGTVAALVAAARSKARRSPAFRKLYHQAEAYDAAIGPDARIVRGPDELVGVHVQDVPTLQRELSRLGRDGKACERAASTPRARATFDRKADAVGDLLDANPELRELVDSDCGEDCRAYERWVAGGRRGPKPRLAPGDGRFDSLNEGLEKRGARAVASWKEAVDVTAPPTRHWTEMPPRLELLEQDAGIPLREPEPVERLAVQAADREHCRETAEELQARLMDQAQRERLLQARRRRQPPEDVPF